MTPDRIVPGVGHPVGPLPPSPVDAPAPETPWDAHPIVKRSTLGDEIEFFRIGALAKALNRSAYTIRLWERKGFIPKARYGKKHFDTDVKTRLYLRGQIEGLVRIMKEEGIFGRYIVLTSPEARRFKQRAEALFKGDPNA